MSGDHSNNGINPRRSIASAHMQAGEYNAALAFFEQQVIENPAMASWNEYATALLCAGELAKAEQAYRRPRDLPSPHGNVTLSVGTALWLQGRYFDALEDCRDELDRLMSAQLKRYDASRVFICAILWWACRRLETPKVWKSLGPQLKLVLKTRGQQEAWCSRIMQLIEGRITPAELLSSAPDVYGVGDVDPTHRAAMRRVTQAYFYAAGKHEAGSDNWRNALTSAIQNGNPSALSYPEYHIAKYELERS